VRLVKQAMEQEPLGLGNQARDLLCCSGSSRTGPLTDAKILSKLHMRTAFIPQCIHAYYSKCSVASLILSTLMCVQHTEANSMESSLVSGLA
jgi:hypothetical protein